MKYEELKREHLAALKRMEQQSQEIERLKAMQEEFEHAAHQATERDASMVSTERQAEEEMRKERREQDSQLQPPGAEITNPYTRYNTALYEHYDINHHDESLAKASMAEYRAFKQEHQRLERQIEQAQDPFEQKSLTLQRDIVSNEYMAITSERIAALSEANVGRSNTQEAVIQRSRADDYSQKAGELRREYMELQAERAQQAQKDSFSDSREFPEANHDMDWDDKARQPQPEHEHALEQNEKEAETSLMVEKKEGGKTVVLAPLTEFVKSHQEWERPGADIKNQWLRDEWQNSCRNHALDNLSRDEKDGRNLNADDIQNLREEDLKGIDKKGPSYLKDLIKEHEHVRQMEEEMER